MSGSHVIRGSVSLPEAELMWRFSRSSGPGGQHVNTSDSKVELSFDLAKTEALPAVWKQRALERLAGRLVDGVVTVRSSEHRSQWRNREAAAVRLTALLARGLLIDLRGVATIHQKPPGSAPARPRSGPRRSPRSGGSRVPGRSLPGRRAPGAR